MTKLEYIARSLSRGTSKKYETYVVNAIYHRINDPQLEIVTQKHVAAENKSYYIDLYLPQFNLAIEVDEWQHAGAQHGASDKRRELDIIEESARKSVGGRSQVGRRKAHDVTLDELNKQIDDTVNVIKAEISRRGKLEWLYGAEKTEMIKKRGTITTTDCFETNRDIINIVYGKNLKGYQRAGYKDLWFPVISECDPKTHTITSRAGWINYFHPKTQTIIYEKSNDPVKQEDKKRAAVTDAANKKTRIVFIKEKDEYGTYIKRFAGVFVAGGWDEKEQAEIWKLKDSEIKIPIK